MAVDLSRVLTNPMEHSVFKANFKLCADKTIVNATMVVSDVALYLVSSENGEIIASHSLFELRSCQIIEGYVVMTFERDVHRLEGSEYASSMLGHLTSQIIQCFLPSEYPKMPRPIQKLGYSVPFQQFFQRFRAKLRHRGKSLKVDVLQKLKEYIQTRPKIFDTDAIDGLDEVLDVVLESLLIEPSVTGIRVNKDPYGDKWKTLAIFAQRESSIVSIRSSIPLNEFFRLFMDTWVKSSKTNVSRLCIADTVVDTASVASISPAMTTGKMKCLAFENVVFGPDVDHKLRDELRKDMKMKAISFSNMFLDRFPQIPTGIFFGIQAITLRGCNLEIATLMKMIVKAPQVTFCDLSGNLGLQSGVPDGRLPPSLKKLILDHIEWRSDALIDVFRFSSTGEDHLLSVGNAKLTQSEWLQFFKGISLMEAKQLGGLIWRGNPFHKGMADYLLRATKLRYLSLAGCSFPQQANEVVSIFERHPTLSIFDLHGCNGQKFNNLLLLQAIATNQVMERVDISNNDLGMYEPLQIVNAMIIAMKQNGEVILDGNKFCTTDGMKSIANSIKTRGPRPIFVAFPSISCPRLDRETQGLFKSFNRKDVGRNAYDEYWSMLLAREYRNEIPAEKPTEENTQRAAANTVGSQQKDGRNTALVSSQHQSSTALPQQSGAIENIQGLLGMQIQLSQQSQNDGVSGLAACIPSSLLSPQKKAPAQPVQTPPSPAPAPRVHMREQGSRSPTGYPSSGLDISWQLDTIEPPAGSIEVAPLKTRHTFTNCMSELQRAVNNK